MSDINQPSLKDAGLIQTKALPSSAGSVYTTAFDLGDAGKKHIQNEIKIEAPALGTTALPNAETMKYAVQDSANNSSFSTIAGDIVVQTGAGGAGDDAASGRFRLPSSCRRYVRVAATGSTSIGDCSGSSVTASLLGGK